MTISRCVIFTAARREKGQIVRRMRYLIREFDRPHGINAEEEIQYELAVLARKDPQAYRNAQEIASHDRHPIIAGLYVALLLLQLTGRWSIFRPLR